MAPKSKDGWVDMPPDQPRTCGLCGGPIVLGGKNLRSTWFKTCPPVATWHFECPQRQAA